MLFKAKRALSCLLTVLLLLTMLPVSAFAVDGEEDLKATLGITNEDITVTEIDSDVEAQLSKAAQYRDFGIYEDPTSIYEAGVGKIYSACHIASSDPSVSKVTITMNEPTLETVSKSNFAAWVVLALVDGQIVTYPTEEDGAQLTFDVRLGEKGTDLALSYVSNLPLNPQNNWGTLELEPGEIKKIESLGYVQEYHLTYTLSKHISDYLSNMSSFTRDFDLVFYLNSNGLKIDAETVSFGENDLFNLDREGTKKIDDGRYMFTVSFDLDAWYEGETTQAVGISYAAPNSTTLLFEGELWCDSRAISIIHFPGAEMLGCVPLPLTEVPPVDDGDTYHKITVTQTDGGEISPRGVEGEVWVKENENQTFTITPDQGYHIEDVVVDGKSVGAQKTYTFEQVNDDNHSITATFAENPAVTITPANLTIYEGGDAGYEGVVDKDGDEITNTSSFPEPLFKIDMPADSTAAPTELTFTNNNTHNSWKVEAAGTDLEGTTYYRLDNTNESGDPIRVQFIDENNNVIESDAVTTTDEVFDKHQIAIFSDENDVVTATAGETDYNVTAKRGELTVRAVADTAPTSDIAAAAPTEAPITGEATAVAPAGTTYTIGETGVSVSGGAPSLLFDSIIEDADSTARTDALEDRIQTVFGEDTTVYEIKYLDLVDANNGNAWIKADKPVDIYWGYPTGTNQSTTFTVVHFKDLHRDGAQSGFEITDIENCEVETIQAVSTGQGIKFSVQPGQFSPFALVQEIAEEPDPGTDPNPGGGSGGGSDNSDPTGNLTISLGGNGGNEDFTFTVIFTDEDGDELENNFYYNGDYTGTIGSGDEITLTGGDKIVIRNLPEGTRYEVIIETADGYTATSTGAEGVIRTSGNEAAFSVTPTVVLADPSVTGVTRWLNTTDHTAYLSGYPGGTFGPDNSMTRAEVAQMFYALLLNKDVTITKTFSDVPADAWYATAVNTLASLGMVSGDPDGTFRPNDPITRAEFCVIALAFAYEPDNAVCYFGDVSRSDWFYTYVAQAASYGWIGGYTNGNFGPNDQITRAQVTTIVNNMLGRAADRDYVIDHQADLVQFSDLTRAHWGYFQIMEATNAHNYTKSNGTESWR